MTLLIASSLLCTIEAVTLTAVSGREVPIATIVRPMMIDGTFSFLAMLELPSTKKSAPLIRNTKPTIKNTTTSASGALFIYFSISCSFRFGFEAILSVFIFSFFATYHTTNPYLRKEIAAAVGRVRVIFRVLFADNIPRTVNYIPRMD